MGLFAPEGEEPGLLGSDSRLLSPLSALLFMLKAMRLIGKWHAHMRCTTQRAFAALAQRLSLTTQIVDVDVAPVRRC